MGRLFGSSGVRGLVGTVLSPQLACNVGLAVATYAKARRVVIGRDTRVSGPMLERGLVSGLVAGGADVSILGVLPTPAVAYITKTLNADSGLMITASHNPPEYNGIKMFRQNSLSYTEEDQNVVEDVVEKKSYTMQDWKHVGTSTQIESSQIYSGMLKKAASLHKTWNIVLDPGCGATYKIAPSVLNALGCKTTSLNAQPDGTFPARSSEPTAASLLSLEKVVTAVGADVGIAFDGDGDRAAFVDDRGVFVDFDRALAAFGAYVLEKQKGGTLVTNVEASMCVETMAAKYGGKVVRSRVGDVYVSEAMARENALFGGEPCGAWVHPQWHWCPDGPLSAILLLRALEDSNLDLSEFVDEVPEYITLRENLSCKTEQKQSIIALIEKKIIEEFPSHTDLSTIDGVRLALKDGWILIRASGTEPMIRLTVEGISLNAARDIMKRGVELVKSYTGEYENESRSVSRR